MMEQMSRIATVTDIRKIDDKRFCLFVDYEPFSSVYASDIRRLHLACDGEIEWSKLEEFRRDYLFKRAMNKAVNSIKFSDKCEYDIRQKLKDLYYDEEIVDQTIDKLKSYGYIDDYRYACGFVRRNSAKKGIRVMRFELQAKHIGQDIIDLAVEDSDISDESDRITYILQKKYTVEELTEKRDKVYAYMYSKGFDRRKVSECIRNIVSDIT